MGWEAELALESPETSQPSEEARLATLMQNAPIPIINSPPERTWIWSDLHLADRAVLAAWNRPFRNIEEMNRHLLREWSRRVHADDTIHLPGRRRPSRRLARPAPGARHAELSRQANPGPWEP